MAQLIFSGPLSLTTNNLVFDDCGCELTCTLTRDPGGPPSNPNISRIELITVGGNTSSIVSIDGVPYTTPTGPPMTIPISAFNPTIEIVFQINAPINIGQIDNLVLELDWFRGGNSGTFTYPITLENVNPVLYWTPPVGPIDFGVVPVGGTGQVTRNFSNPTVCDHELLINNLCPDVTLNQSSPWIIPAGSNSDVEFTWTPTTPGPLDCTVNFTGCELDTIFRFVGSSIIPSNCFNCIDVVFETENGYLTPAPGLCADFAADGRFDRAAIGEKKKIRFDFFYSTGLVNGLELWFNPEMFADVCDFASKYPGAIIDSPPAVAYYIQFFTGIGSAPMNLIGAGANANNNKNFAVTFIETGANNFSIEFEFFFTIDVDEWINGASVINQQRLLRNSVFATSDLTNSIPSIYNQLRKACFFFFLRDPSVLVPDPITGGTVPFTCFEEKSIKTTARFYNVGLQNGPTEFNNPGLQLTRSGSPVTNFSSFSNTEATFTVDAPMGPPGAALDNCIFWLFDENNFDQAVDFVDNYDTSRAEIVTGAGGLDNHLTGPSVAPTLVSGSTYEVKANVANSVQVGQSFYLAAICYSTAANVPNTFLFGPFEVTDQPGLEDACCDLDTDHEFSNYNQTFETDCFLPTVKERINSRFKIRGGDFADTCLVSFGLPAPKRADWVSFVTAIELLVCREVADYPNPGETTTFVFGKYRSERNIAFPSNWNDLNPPFRVQDGGITQFPEPEIQCDFNTRVRYEENITPSTVLVANNATPFTRSTVGPLAPTYIAANNISFDWANQDVFFEYRVEFDVSSLIGTPYTINHVKRAKITPFDFESERGFVGLDDIDFFLADPENPLKPGAQSFGPFCPGSAPGGVLFVRTKQTVLRDMNLIATIDPFPFGNPYLQEEESYPPPASIPLGQLTASELFDVDQVFGPDQFAWFTIDLTQLGPGKYQICSIGIDK